MTSAAARPGDAYVQSATAASSRVVLLWAALGLFLLRVIGQVEVWLLAPDWLPPMDAWYSGLLPYPLLLPAQMLLLMGMAVLAHIHTSPRYRNASLANRTAAMLRTVAVLYFGVMVLRLAVTVRQHGDEFYLHGAIPIAFHWVLALFLLVLARRGKQDWTRKSRHRTTAPVCLVSRETASETWRLRPGGPAACALCAPRCRSRARARESKSQIGRQGEDRDAQAPFDRMPRRPGGGRLRGRRERRAVPGGGRAAAAPARRPRARARGRARPGRRAGPERRAGRNVSRPCPVSAGLGVRWVRGRRACCGRGFPCRAGTIRRWPRFHATPGSFPAPKQRRDRECALRGRPVGNRAYPGVVLLPGRGRWAVRL